MGSRPDGGSVMGHSNVKDLEKGNRPAYVTAGWLPLDHTSARLERWMEAHHNPKFKPSKPRFPRTEFRKFTAQQLKRHEWQWEEEIKRQVARHGAPTHELRK